MPASILATVPALQEIPRRKDKLPVFAEIVINLLYRLTARVVVPGDAGRRIFRRNSLKILGYFLFNNYFQTVGAAAVLTEIKRHDRRIIRTPTRFTFGFPPTDKSRAAYRTILRLHSISQITCQAASAAIIGSFRCANSNAPNITAL